MLMVTPLAPTTRTRERRTRPRSTTWSFTTVAGVPARPVSYPAHVFPEDLVASDLSLDQAE